jgi:CDP-paratose 2-epimerase
MSCIYGPHQFGTEDQGWVAHFLLCALREQPITIFGDGFQVRDLLFVEDLVNAFLAARTDIEALSGKAFNIGGGPENAASLVEVLEIIEQATGKRPQVAFDDWRVGDQKCYVSDTTRFGAATGWRPRVSVRDGIERLAQWAFDEGIAPEPKYALQEGIA